MRRTAGASAVLIREMMRKAALYAASQSAADRLVVKQRHVDDALHELVVAGGALTRSLLDASSTPIAGG